jgi:hypothetical protein
MAKQSWWIEPRGLYACVRMSELNVQLVYVVYDAYIGLSTEVWQVKVERTGTCVLLTAQWKSRKSYNSAAKSSVDPVTAQRVIA